MKKMILAGASAFAILSFANAASAQVLPVDVSIDIGANIEGLFDLEDFAGVYVNAAVNAAAVDGSVNIDAASLVPGLNASELDVLVEGSTAVAAALGQVEADLDLVGVPALGIGVDGLAIAAANASQIGINVVGNRISSAAEIATTAIGAVNEGVIAIGPNSTRDLTENTFEFVDGGSLDFASSAADSAANTTNTAARAAAATSSLVIDGADSILVSTLSDIQSTGPSAILAANVAANIFGVDGSVNLGGATINDITGTATTAIGAVNTGTITNALPAGGITIVVGGDD